MFCAIPPRRWVLIAYSTGSNRNRQSADVVTMNSSQVCAADTVTSVQTFAASGVHRPSSADRMIPMELFKRPDGVRDLNHQQVLSPVEMVVTDDGNPESAR